MRMGARLFATAAVILMVAQPAQARWVETTTEHFVIYGDLSDNEAAGYAMLLERFDDLLRGIAKVPRKIESEADRVTVYVVPLGTVQSLARSSNIGGFYNSNAQSTIAVMPTTVPSYWDMGPYHVMFHEYT